MKSLDLLLEAIDAAAEQWDDGISIEDFTAVYSLYRACQRAGLVFDESFTSRMEELAMECTHTSDDSDSDVDEETRDCDDSPATSYQAYGSLERVA